MPQLGSEYFNLSPEMLCVVDSEGRFIEINPSWEKNLGWKIEEFVAHSFKDLIHPDDVDITMNEFSKLTIFNGYITSGFENRYKHKDGGYRWLQWSASPINDKKIFCVARDITQSKKDAELLAITQEVSLVGSWEIDLETNELFWSKRTHQIHETDSETYRPLLNDGIRFFSPDSQVIISKNVEKLLRTGEAYDIELPFVTAKGRKTWVRCIARASCRDGVVIRVYGTIEDVSLKKREKSLHELIIENGNYGTWDWDLETNNVYFNDRFCSIVGLDVKNIKHELATWDILTHPEDKVMAYKDIEDHLAGKTPYYRNVHRMKHVDGHWVWILDQGKIVEYRDGKPVRFSGTHTDITYLKNLEEEKITLQAIMISSAKLSSLGEMASGIAHEINNPLAIIKGKAYQVLRNLETGEIDVDFLKKEISKIEHNCQRIVKIIKGLRTFSRQGEGDPFQVIFFKSLLDDVLELCNERFKHQGVKILISGDPEIKILCQETQFAQVLLNLINNAYDAVHLLESPWVEVNVEKVGEIVKISITDSGHGIDEIIAQKIMQPFFTTKDVGVGTGLGLSISKGIVEMHNGKFYLDHNCSNTRFVIELPSKEEYSM